MKDNQYVIQDRSQQHEFDYLCHAATVRHLLVHSLITILMAAAVIGISG